MGDREQTSDPPGARAELAFAIVGAVAFTVAALLCLWEQVTRGAFVSRGVYGVLAAFMCIGGVGWTVVWSVARAEARIRRQLLARALQAANQQAEIKGALAELTSAVRLQAQRAARPVYVARSAQEQTVPQLPRVKRGMTDYWQVYSDVMEDLGGVDGRPTQEP